MARPRPVISLEHVETRARKDGSDYVINGAKAVVLGGDTADKLIVSARTDGETTDRNGITLFLVDGNAAGIHKRSYRNMDDRGAAEITFENVRVPESAVLGAVGAGLPLVEAANDRAAAALCCEGIGAMKAVNEITLEYLKTRNQYRTAHRKFQVLQHRMADMAMAEEQARSMVYLAVDFANEPDAAERAPAISQQRADREFRPDRRAALCSCMAASA